MDICSGHGGVSRSVRRFGFQSKFWDVRHGEAHDITNPYVLGRIISEIQERTCSELHVVSAVHSLRRRCLSVLGKL